jgi:hypothetical protein
LSEGLSGVPQRRGFSTILVDILISMVVDWDVPLRMGNAWYDRHVEACGKPTRAERQAALSKLDGDLHMLRATMRDGKSLGRALLRNPQHAISEWMGGGFVRVLMPALWAAASAEERVTLQFELTRLAFALAAYRADRGAYPAGLAELGPQYAPKSRKGILVDAELHYGREGDGYLLYSFGVNGKDDGGRSYEDCRAGEGWDDLAVRTER